MKVRGTGLIAALAAIGFAFTAAQSAQAATISNSILDGGYAKPVLIDPSTGKVRRLPAFSAGRHGALRTSDGRALITAYQRAGAIWVERYSLANGKATAIGPSATTRWLRRYPDGMVRRLQLLARWPATRLHPSPPVDADRGAGG